MEQLPRLDGKNELREKILPLCRLKEGEAWEDPENGHIISCMDARDQKNILKLAPPGSASLAIHDPPYNLILRNRNSSQLGKTQIDDFIDTCRNWIKTSEIILKENAHLYIWLGADQNAGFQPLPEFMLMMREFEEFKSRSFITMRNQRGYGTAKNWMSVRQELLYYIKGKPGFNTEAVYTDIPKIMNGYYKNVNGKKTTNFERSRSDKIRAGNVWVDIQQIFYRMKENVAGCYAQKPVKAIERIIKSSSDPGDLVIDFFAHSGTTLIAAEKNDRRCFTLDLDPIFAEVTIRRLENYRKTGEPGWQFANPFPELDGKLL